MMFLLKIKASYAILVAATQPSLPKAAKATIGNESKPRVVTGDLLRFCAFYVYCPSEDRTDRLIKVIRFKTGFNSNIFNSDI